MILAQVVGTVVASRNTDGVDRGRYLLVRPADSSGVSSGEPMVALDGVQADRGQLVIVAQGSSCRQLVERLDTRDRAVDALVVGIVDTVDVADSTAGKEGKRGYRAL